MLEEIIEKMDTVYFEEISIIETESIFYHSCSVFSASKILENGFKGHLDNLHCTILNSGLNDNDNAVVFATTEPQNEYGNTIIQIKAKQAIKAFHTEYSDWEVLIQLSDIIEISEYCE